MSESAKKDKNLEMVAFGIIANSGDCRSHAFEALDAAEQGNFELARERLDQAKESMKLAHKEQTSLLFDEVNGKLTPITLLMVHAQDHLMTSMLAVELIERMVSETATRTDQIDELKEQIAGLQKKFKEEQADLR